jgi:cytochrome c-type biogenesis protein CcmE
MTDPRRQRRLWYAIGGVLVVAFLAYGATSFKTNLTPYVSFEEAMRSGAKVQVAGGLVPGSTQYGEGRTLTVLYQGTKPGNFEEATQVVAIGSYRGGAFHADQLLVKCPSKYQGIPQDGAASAAGRSGSRA